MDQPTRTLTQTAEPASQPAVTAGRDAGAMPERTAEFLGILAILAEYGRDMVCTIEERATRNTFATIAQFFGTIVLSAILPRLQRGIMRAVALERVLRARAKRGRDIEPRMPRIYLPRPPRLPALPGLTGLAATAATAAADASSAQPAATPQPTRRAHRYEDDDRLTFATMPTMKQIEAEVRRRPPGRTIVDIMCDLGLSLSLCSPRFGNRLFHAVHWNGGSLTRLMLEMRRREKLFRQNEWQYPNLPQADDTREGAQSALGYTVGEEPEEAAERAATDAAVVRCIAALEARAKEAPAIATVAPAPAAEPNAADPPLASPVIAPPTGPP